MPLTIKRIAYCADAKRTLSSILRVTQYACAKSSAKQFFVSAQEKFTKSCSIMNLPA